MDFKIEKLNEIDIDELYDLGCSQKDFSADGGENCFWPKETLQRLVKSELDVTLKLVVKNKIVGFSLVMIHPSTKKAFLENFYVKKEFKELEQEFYLEVENKIKTTDAQFIAYFFDTKDDSNSIDLFKKNEYFQGNEHLWLHKNISFSNPVPKE